MSIAFAEMEGIINGLRDILQAQQQLASTRSQSVGVKLTDSLQLPIFNSDDGDDWQFFIKSWERVVSLAGHITEGTKLELLHQSIKGSGKEIADAYINGVKTSYDGLKKYLQATYELSAQCRRVRVLKRYNSLRLGNQPSLVDFKKFYAQWVLLCQQLSELGIGLDEKKKALDLLEKFPAEITRYLHLQYSAIIEKFEVEEIMKKVGAYCEHTYGNKESPDLGQQVAFASTGPRTRPICRYYQSGRCKFGEKCRYQHIDGNSRGPAKDKSNWRRNSQSRKCYNCQKTGHLAVNCPLKQVNETPVLTSSGSVTPAISTSSTSIDSASINNVPSSSTTSSNDDKKTTSMPTREWPTVTALSDGTVSYLPCFKVSVGNVMLTACVDTGASRSLLPESVFNKLVIAGELSDRDTEELPSKEVFTGLGHIAYEAISCVKLPVTFHTEFTNDKGDLPKALMSVRCLRAKLPNQIDVLLGSDTLCRLNAMIEYSVAGPRLLHIRRPDLECVIPLHLTTQVESVLLGSADDGESQDCVHLLWKSSARPSLNFKNAQSRAKRLEQRLSAMGLLEEYDAKIQDYLQKKYIIEIPFGKARHFIPHQVVYKPNATSSKVRPVWDARSSGLNSYLLAGPWLHPSLVRILLNWRQAKYWTIGDLQEAFLRVPVSLADTWYLCFIWRNRVYKFQVLPMGLRCSPHLLQLKLSSILPDNGYYSIYMDDISIHSSTNLYREETLKMLKSKLEPANQQFNDLKWITESTKEAKSIVGVRWSGCDEDVIYPTYKQDATIPNVVTKRVLLKHFNALFDPLGLALPVSMYGRSILKLATKYAWDDELPRSFSLLLEKWHEVRGSVQPVKRHLDISNNVVIFCDASEFGCAAVCYVGQNLAFAKGHVWSETEAKWTVPRKELQALVISLDILALWPADKLVSILSDSEINLHRLVNGQSEKLPLPERRRVQKVSEAFERHNVKLYHVASADNKADIPTRPQQAVADLSSWYKLDVVSSMKEFVFNKKIDDIMMCACTASQDYETPTENPTIEEISELQRVDPQWSVLIKYLDNKESSNDVLKLSASEKKKCEKLERYFVLIDRVLYFKGRNVGLPEHRLRLVIPVCLQKRILYAFHGSRLAGHPGRRNTYEAIKSKYFWWGLSTSVKKYVTSCLPCWRRKAVAAPYGYMKLNILQYPWQLTSIDLITDLPVSRFGNRHILVILCNFSHYMITCPLPLKESKVVALAIWKNLIAVHGVPYRLHSDRGGEFTADVSKQFYELFKLPVTFSTAYRPQGNGANERSHQGLMHDLVILIKEGLCEEEDWELALASVTFAHNVRTLPNISLCPYELIYGRRPRLPFEPAIVDQPLQPQKLDSVDYEAFASKLKRVMREGFAFMRDATLDDRLKQKARYDNTRKEAPSITVGDKVLVRRFTNTRLGYRWSKPLKVKEVTKNGSLYLQDDADPMARLVGPVNVDHVLSIDNIEFRLETIETSVIPSDVSNVNDDVVEENVNDSRIRDIERFIHSLVLSKSAPMYIADLQSYIRREFGMTRDDFKSVGGLRGFIQSSKNIALDPYDAVIAVTRVFEI